MNTARFRSKLQRHRQNNKLIASFSILTFSIFNWKLTTENQVSATTMAPYLILKYKAKEQRLSIVLKQITQKGRKYWKIKNKWNMSDNLWKTLLHVYTYMCAIVSPLAVVLSTRCHIWHVFLPDYWCEFQGNQEQKSFHCG